MLNIRTLLQDIKANPIIGVALILFVICLITLWSLMNAEKKADRLIEENKSIQSEIEDLRLENTRLARLREDERNLRLAIEDSLKTLQIVDEENKKKLLETKKRYETIIKNTLGSINTDHERDSVLSEWYPSPGQRNIPTELESGHDD